MCKDDRQLQYPPIDTLTLGVPIATDNCRCDIIITCRPNDSGQMSWQIPWSRGHGRYRIAVLIPTLCETITIQDTTRPVLTFMRKRHDDHCNTRLIPWSGYRLQRIVRWCDIIITYGCSDGGQLSDRSVITRTWTLSDSCANSITCVLKITIQDTTKPYIDFMCKRHDMINCNTRLISWH